jgi:hypothetical protein
LERERVFFRRTFIMIPSSRLSWLSSLALVLALGCGGGSNPNAPSTVHGTVKYGDKTVPDGMIKLVFQKGGGVITAALHDGRYEATDVPLGEAKVTVDTSYLDPNQKVVKYGGSKGVKSVKDQPAPTASGMSPHGQGGGAPGVYMKIPMQYANPTTTPLSITVKKGDNPFDIELKDK